MKILDRCKQITDTESGRVLLYRDEVEAVLSAGDTISRRQAIDALGDEPEVWSGKDEYAQGLNNQWHYDRNAIKALPSAQPERQWETCFDCPLSHSCPKIRGCTNDEAVEYASSVPNDCPLNRL